MKTNNRRCPLGSATPPRRHRGHAAGHDGVAPEVSAEVSTCAGGLPPTLDLTVAGRMLGIGRSTAYRLAGAGAFPCVVLRIGNKWRVPSRALLDVLAIPTPDPASGGAPADAARSARVWHEFTGGTDV